MKPCLLLVDSEPGDLKQMEETLLSHHWHTVAVGSGRAALKLDVCSFVKVAVVSMDLADMKGYQLIPRIRQMFPGVEFIVTTSDYRADAEREARKAGILTYLTKPLNYRLLRRVIQKAMDVDSRSPAFQSRNGRSTCTTQTAEYREREEQCHGNPAHPHRR